MPPVLPFIGVRYATERHDNAATLLDDAERWEAIASGSGDRKDESPVPAATPYHVSHLYRDWVGATAAAWLNEGRLVSDPGPAIYLYRQRRPVPQAWRGVPGVPESAAFIGFLASVDVSPDSPLRAAQHVDPQAVDRLVPVMKAFAFDIAPAWGVFLPSAAGGAGAAAMQAARPVLESAPLAELPGADGAVHQLWRLEPDVAEAVRAALAEVPVAVVTGAARLAALRSMATRPSPEGVPARLLMLLSPAEGDPEGVAAVLPVHRLVLARSRLHAADLEERIRPFFRILDPPAQEAASSPQSALAQLGALRGEFNGFVLYTGGGRFRLVRSKGRMFMENWTHPLGRAAWRSIDVNILHALVFERALGLPVADSRLCRPPIALEGDLNRAVQRVDRGEAVAAFLLVAPPLEQVCRAAMDNNPLPAEALRLWPPPAAGVVLRRRR